MNKCSLNTINLRKNQYRQIAGLISTIIKDGELPDNSVGFEIAKQILIEGNGLDTKQTIRTVFKTIIGLLLDILLQALSFLIAIFTTDFNKYFTTETVILLFFFFVMLAVIRIFIKGNEETTDNIEDRVLKTMSYEEYIYFLSLEKD